MKHFASSTTQFRKHIETPLTVGTALTLYQKNRSRADIDVMFDLSLGVSYENVQRITTRIQRYALKQAEESSMKLIILPFVMKGVRPIFAADNIDFGSDCVAFHGADLLLAQGCSTSADCAVNQIVLDTDHNLRSSPDTVGVTYMSCTKPTHTDIKHSGPVVFGTLSDYSHELQQFDLIWLLLASNAVRQQFCVNSSDGTCAEDSYEETPLSEFSCLSECEQCENTLDEQDEPAGVMAWSAFNFRSCDAL
jgi:hypothetical protein